MVSERYKLFQTMLANAHAESDRACALILAANLDNRLKDVLSAFFVVMSENQEKEIFSGNGALSTFSSKIKLAYALGFLANDERHDLDIIRKVRNDFAHVEEGLDFSSEQIKSRCNSFIRIAEMNRDYPKLRNESSNPRGIFNIAAASLSICLMDRADTAKQQQRSVFPPVPILPKKA